MLLGLPAIAHTQDQVPPDLQEAMRARDKAAAEKNATVWDRFTADEFIVVLQDGVRRTKADRLAHLKTQKPGVWVQPQQELVRVYGNMAVQHFLSDGDWAMVVWVKGSKDWQVVAAQDTPAKM
jgi:hypothetical protein